MPHHHFPKIYCSNDDVILSNYHHHSFRSLPTYLCPYVLLNITSSLLQWSLGKWWWGILTSPPPFVQVCEYALQTTPGFFLDISKKTQAKKNSSSEKTQAHFLPKTQGTGVFLRFFSQKLKVTEFFCDISFKTRGTGVFWEFTLMIFLIARKSTLTK